MLNLHHTTFTKHLANGTYYLGKYLFTRDLVDTAVVVNMTLPELTNMLNKDRVQANLKKANTFHSVSLALVHEISKEQHSFTSIGAAIVFLKAKGHKADRRVLITRLANEDVYYGYRCVKASI